MMTPSLKRWPAGIVSFWLAAWILVIPLVHAHPEGHVHADHEPSAHNQHWHHGTIHTVFETTGACDGDHSSRTARVVSDPGPSQSHPSPDCHPIEHNGIEPEMTWDYAVKIPDDPLGMFAWTSNAPSSEFHTTPDITYGSRARSDAPPTGFDPLLRGPTRGPPLHMV